MRRIPLLLTVCAIHAHAQTPPAQIAGSVTSLSGQPVPAATITLRRIPQLRPPGAQSGTPYALAPGEQRFSRAVVAGQSGTFSAAELPAGNYYLCATPASAQYLDGCQWDPVRHLLSHPGSPSQAWSWRCATLEPLR